MVPFSNYIAFVDLAPTYRHCAGCRLDAAGVVVSGRSRRWRDVCGDARVHRLADWAATVVGLVSRLLLSPVQRDPASLLGRRLRLRDPKRLSYWLRCARRDRLADNIRLALRASGLGGLDGKQAFSVEFNCAARRLRTSACEASRQRSQWAARVAIAALDGCRAYSARALFCS